MNSINRVFIVGRLGAKPEIKTSRKGKPYAHFNVATDSFFRKEDGSSEKTTEWHKVMVWGADAERCAERLDKGSPVFVEGELNHYKVEEDGQTRYRTSVKAQNVSFLSMPLHSASAS